ncbi:MAG TPA: sugar ABC transporter substrate-binding protein [Brevefilum sp.]|nr:sugar ABC transporter substrate-binding protein [Brevefilum sp.]
MKKIVLMLMSVLLILSLFSACAPVTTDTEEPGPVVEVESSVDEKPEKITFWMMKIFVDTGNESVEARVEEFTKATGIPVDLELIAINDLMTRWSAAVESGNLPDLTYMDYNNLGGFQSRGLMLDVSETVDEIQRINGEMSPALLTSFSYGGQYYGVPMWAEPTVLYYRADLFEEAGIKSPPETWDEFIDDATLLTDPDTGVYGAGFCIGMDCTDSEWWFRDILWSYGASLLTADGKSSAVEEPEFREASQWIVDFFLNENKINPPSAIGWDDGGNNQAYLSGQSAMVINTGSVYNAIFNTDDYPDLKEQTKLALVPGGPEGRFITGISNGLAVFKDAKNPYWGQQLMIWMMDKEWQREWMTHGGYQIVPAYPELTEDEFWQNEYGKVFCDIPNYYAFLGYPGDFSPAAGEITKSFLLTRNLQEVIVNNQALDDMITQLHIDITDVIEKHK